MYETDIHPEVNKSILKRDGKFRTRVYDKIEKLKTNPYKEGKKLKGVEFYGVRIGDYRLIYLVDDKEKVVKIYYLEHRKKSYGKHSYYFKKI